MKQIHHVRWQRSRKFLIFARRGMYKSKNRRMECLSLEFRSFASPVHRIAHQRMADKLHMHANLMSSPGLQLQLQQRIIPKALHNMEMGHRMLAVVIDDGVLFTVMRVTSDGSIHGALIMAQIAMNERQVSP